MRLTTIAVAAIALAVAACKGSDQGASPQGDASASAPSTSAATDPPALTPAQPVKVEIPSSPPPPPPPSHNYAYEQDGLYGYEQALSENDIKSGQATKPLVMMRYLGQANGIYAVFIPDNDSGSRGTRVSCSVPCQFAKTQTIANGMVFNTQTVPVPRTSLIGAMLEDAMTGQLVPFGSAPAQPTAPAAPAPAVAFQPATVQPAVATVPQLPTPPAAVTPGPAQTTTIASQASSSAPSLGQVQVTSFDCSMARSIPEYLICHDPDLAASDRELANVYQQAKAAVQDQAAFKERTRKQWNYREKNCKDKACLVSWYTYQKDALTKIAQTGNVNAQ